MKTIYIDSENKCHLEDDGTRTAVETDVFEGACQAYIEGFCYVAEEGGVSVYPWKDYDELRAVQAAYEHDELARLRAENAEYEAALTSIEAALEVNG